MSEVPPYAEVSDCSLQGAGGDLEAERGNVKMAIESRVMQRIHHVRVPVIGV